MRADIRLKFRRMVAADLARDLPQLMELQSTAFSRPWSQALVERELTHDWSRVLLACDEGAVPSTRPLGFIVFWLVHDEIQILNLAVDVDKRRKGIGRALIEEACNCGKEQGARLATLEARRSNTAALQLYESLGFQTVGIRPNYYREEGEDAIVMVRDLT